MNASCRHAVLVHSAAISRHVFDAIVFKHIQDLLRQCPDNLDRVYPLDILCQPLPSCHPRSFGVVQRDEAFEDLRGAFCDGVSRVTQAEYLFAIGAAVLVEFLRRARGQGQADITAQDERLTCSCWTMEQTMQARVLPPRRAMLASRE
jgi:hypothetical protein